MWSKFAGVVQCAGVLRIDGYAKVGSQFTCERIGLNGFMSLKGNYSAESFESRGSFRIQGLLNAGTIDIELHSECRAREIGGDRICVRKSRKANPIAKLVKALTFNKEQLTVETIEGDDIQLEYTKADIVRGNHISIGPGCEIGLVEYSGKFAQHQDAKVKDRRKI
ncbi:cell shape determination protein CcmA [Paenibacillus sp. GCM10012303]|uniref:cell shape determination protein CcmA n=1 Tax=Paenibacillus sp. GCM10012303 TaxID=3317340 RepID=UPI00362259FD